MTSASAIVSLQHQVQQNKADLTALKQEVSKSALCINTMTGQICVVAPVGGEWYVLCCAISASTTVRRDASMRD
jgi:ABC-type phosphate transport system auxiliary subunit